MHKFRILYLFYQYALCGTLFVDKKLVSKANENSIVLHCLPAYRGKEITEEVMDSEKSRIFNQAENRLHVQQALLAALIKN